jgi:flagellar basal body-associated protein FliL
MELEFDTPLDSTSEIKLGNYVMSIAARQQQDVSRAHSNRQWVQLRITMHVIVDPENESAVRSEIERHKGLLDDTILTVCRNASLDALSDNGWVIMKSRIIDNIRPILGQDSLRQLVVSNIIIDTL